LPLARRSAVQGPSIEQAVSTADLPTTAAQGQQALPVQTSLADVSVPARESSMTSHSTASPPPMETDLPARVSPEQEQAPAASERPTPLAAGDAIPTLPLGRRPSFRGWTAPAAPAWATAATAPVIGARPLTATPSVQRFAPALALPEAASGLALAQSLRESPQRMVDGRTETGFAEAFEAETRTTSDLMPSAAALPDNWARSVPQPAAWSPAASLPLAPTRGLTVQRAGNDSAAEAADEPEAEAPMLQGAWYDAPAARASSSVSAASPASAGPAIGAAPASSASHANETDMDELAGRLYDRIRTRLKSELLVDRERAGFLTDLR
jgi:hypothetical protein